MIGSSHRLTIGEFTAVILCDADQKRDARALWSNTPAAELEAGFRNEGSAMEDMAFSMNILYLHRGDDHILIDTGLGPGMSQLPETLAHAGIELRRINHVIITHGHRDHIGGLLNREGGLTFSKAQIYWWKSEWDHWLHEAQESNDREHPARKVMFPIQHQVRLIEAAGEFLPGIHAVPAPGHTPGHIALLIESQGESLLHLADAAHSPIQSVYSHWSPPFDSQPELARETRKSLFNQAADEQRLTLAYHFPFPGLGHFVRQEDIIRWRST